METSPGFSDSILQINSGNGKVGTFFGINTFGSNPSKGAAINICIFGCFAIACKPRMSGGRSGTTPAVECMANDSMMQKINAKIYSGKGKRRN